MAEGFLSYFFSGISWKTLFSGFYYRVVGLCLGSLVGRGKEKSNDGIWLVGYDWNRRNRVEKRVGNVLYVNYVG